MTMYPLFAQEVIRKGKGNAQKPIKKKKRKEAE